VERAARDARLAGAAKACRNRAAVALLQGDIGPEVFDALSEVA
jgi:hypothetical protein